PPPEIEGRTGYYGPEHAARLDLIAEMQADGFNLAAIKRLLENTAGSESEVLGFKRALLGWEEEEPEFVTADELAERLRLAADAVLAVFRRAMSEATEERFGKELESGARGRRGPRGRAERQARARG